MKRRQFITLLGGAAVTSVKAHAQQAMPVIGFFMNGTADGYAAQTRAFRQGLQKTGFREHQNVTITYRWTDGQLDRIPAMAAELMQARVSILVTNGGTVRAATAATKTIPIVFVGGDPVPVPS